MITIEGTYNTAIVYIDEIESSARGQIQSLCDMEVYKDSRIRMMPDVHAGKGSTVGTTMTLHGAVCPNAVGSDISCGMLVAQIREKHLELQKLDKICHQDIPHGPNTNKLNNVHRFINNLHISDLKCKDHVNLQMAYCSISSLGSGNHFIEVDKDDEGHLYIVIHTGSRHLGKEVCNWYQDLAYLQRQIYDGSEAPYFTAWFNDEKTFNNYIYDMKIIEEFAYWNRKAILDVIVKSMKLHVVDEFTTVHNYIDTKNMILRKGACSAQLGERLIIPMNMRDGSLICTGNGNPEWNFSAPHGAGRIMSRKDAKNTLSMSEYREQMKDIYSTCVSKNTVDEAPGTYKKMEDIVDKITDTVEINKVIRPIYNFKAS